MKIVLVVVGLFVVIAIVSGVVVVTIAPEGLLQSLKPEPNRTEVRAELANHGQLVETVAAPGEIEPLTMVEISAEVSSRIEQLPFREGDEVHRDDIIVKLDDRNLSIRNIAHSLHVSAGRFGHDLGSIARLSSRLPIECRFEPAHRDDDLGLTRPGIDIELVDQPSGAGKTRPEAAARSETVLHRAVNVGDAWTIVFDNNPNPCMGFIGFIDHAAQPRLRILDDIPGQFGNRRGQARLVAQAEPEVSSELTALAPRFYNVRLHDYGNSLRRGHCF